MCVYDVMSPYKYICMQLYVCMYACVYGTISYTTYENTTRNGKMAKTENELKLLLQKTLPWKGRIPPACRRFYTLAFVSTIFILLSFIVTSLYIYMRVWL